jgi:UDP-N-acetylmuramoyl-tripeptide--D-alanyl-D-alanine ligase
MRIHTDTRTLGAGDCFVALVGERFDAHAFLPQLKTAGVTVALASHSLAVNGLSGVEVPDTRVALGEWAGLWRESFSGPVIAVTGSNGKTTVTQMLASITTAAHGEDALATQGNLNNDIGVPLTLLRLRSHHRSAVVELGMNHPGEIAYLAAMTRPTVALVNNAQREHLEFMGTVDAVAKENGTVFQSLSPTGIAVYPHADHYSDLWRQQAGARSVFTFSCTDKQATVYASGVWQGDAWALTFVTPEGEFQASLALAGQHNVSNAAAAVACALAAGISPDHITAGLNAFRAVKGRSRAVQLRRDAAVTSLVDDTYNANPDSMRAAIDVLASLPKPRWLVMGDMGEVGAQGLAFHEEALRYAEAQAIERIDVSGQWWRQVVNGQSRVAAHWHSDVEALSALAPEIAASYQSVLVKGSRFMRMERVVEALERAWPSVVNRPASNQEKEGTRHAA